MSNVRLYIDMDGVLAYFNKDIECIDVLYGKNYFSNLKPINTVIDAIKDLKSQDFDIYIMSSVVNSPYALNEKNEWLDKYMPFIDKSKRIFPSYGQSKKDIIKDINKDCFLLDDYTKNLVDWSEKGTGIKLVNNINDTNKSWDGDRVFYNSDPVVIATELKASIYRSLLKNRGIDEKGLFKRMNDAKEKSTNQNVNKRKNFDKNISM